MAEASLVAAATTAAAAPVKRKRHVDDDVSASLELPSSVKTWCTAGSKGVRVAQGKAYVLPYSIWANLPTNAVGLAHETTTETFVVELAITSRDAKGRLNMVLPVAEVATVREEIRRVYKDRKSALAAAPDAEDEEPKKIHKKRTKQAQAITLATTVVPTVDTESESGSDSEGEDDHNGKESAASGTVSTPKRSKK